MNLEQGILDLKRGPSQTIEKNDLKERKEIENEDRLFFEEEKLRMFAEIIDGFEYYITGGLAVELMEGRLKYEHGDIDILVFEDNLAGLKERLKERGFNLIERPKFKGHDLEANLRVGQKHFCLGLFVLRRDGKQNAIQEIEEDGTIHREFPLSYFDQERQSLEYKGSRFVVADLRYVFALKIASERSKDIQDVGRMVPLLKSKFTAQELDDMKDICKGNIKIKLMASIKYTFENLLRTNQEINSENIYNYFFEDIKKKASDNREIEYSRAIEESLESIKEISFVSENNREKEKEFLLFISDKLKPIIDYQNNFIDKTLE